MSDHNFPTPDFIALGKEIKKGVFIIAERECLAFFKESFDKGGFTDVSFQKWEDRKQPDYRTGGALLNATGFLKDSIEVAKKDSNSIIFGSYAKFWGYPLNNLNFAFIAHVRTFGINALYYNKLRLQNVGKHL